MKNTKTNKLYILAIIPILVVLILAHNQEVSAASAVAFDSRQSVYGYSYNSSNRQIARNNAIRSCQKRGGRNCRIVTSCSQDGYGIIYLRRLPGRPIQALGASCGAASIQIANNLAKQACNNQHRGRCGGPKVSWYDSVQARIANSRRTYRSNRNSNRSQPNYSRRINLGKSPRYGKRRNNRARNPQNTAPPKFSNFTTNIRSFTIPGRGGAVEANFNWRAYGGASQLKVHVQVKSAITYRKWTNVLQNQSPVDVGSWAVRGVPGETFHFRAMAIDSRGKVAYSRIYTFR